MYFINKLRHDVGPDMNRMQRLYPRFFNEAMQSPPEAVAEEWDWFSEEFFLNRGRPIPDWNAYREIQQTFGRGKFAVLKKNVEIVLKQLFDEVCMAFPAWQWAAKKRCYLEGALSERYELASGSYSCT